MKQTINEYQFRDAFKRVRPDNFSHEGLGLLFEYLEELEQDVGEEYELDVIALCCDWSECTPDEIMTDYEPDLDGYDDLFEWLNDHTLIAGQTDSGSIVYCAF